MSEITLYKCPVCLYANHESCSVRPEITEAQELCDKFKHNGKAAWVHYSDCPKCENGGMLSQDKFGAFCYVHGCDFKQDYKA